MVLPEEIQRYYKSKKELLRSFELDVVIQGRPTLLLTEEEYQRQLSR